MQLIVIEHAGQPVEMDHRTAVAFRPPGGTIGRDIDNHLVLRDETRQISRLQALLQVGEASCSLKNLSSVSTIEVNQTPIGYAQVQHVRPGDTIRIGAYLLRAESDGGEAAAASSRELPPAVHGDALASGVNRNNSAPSGPSVGSVARAQDLQSLPTDPLQLFASSDVSGIDKLIGPASAPGHRSFAAVHSHAGNAPVTPSDRAHEWAAPFRVQPVRAEHDQQSGAAEASAENSSHTPSGPSRPAPIESGPATADMLLHAFFKGAGLDATAPRNGWSQEQLFVAGQLLGLFANGTVELLSSRSILKREVRADMTMLLDRDNNPLKLLPDGGAALRQMFGLPFPGFMSPQSAVNDAFQDLHAHQIGMVAGMRAALMDLLEKFSPERLVARDVEPRWYERKWPVLRKARRWEHYVARHRDMVLAVEDDFASVFGKSFLEAYDAEVENYRGRRRD